MKSVVSSIQSDPYQYAIDLLKQGWDCWVKLGEFLVAQTNNNPTFIDDLHERCPDVSPETWKRFRDMGLRKLHPQLAISEAPGVKRLRKLPYALQEKYVKEPLPLVVVSNGGVETLSVDVRNLTPDQAAQVFDADGVRSEAAQRAYIEDKAAKSVPVVKASNPPYRIVGREVLFMAGTKCSAEDLTRILSEIVKRK